MCRLLARTHRCRWAQKQCPHQVHRVVSDTVLRSRLTPCNRIETAPARHSPTLAKTWSPAAKRYLEPERFGSNEYEKLLFAGLLDPMKSTHDFDAAEAHVVAARFREKVALRGTGRPPRHRARSHLQSQLGAWRTRRSSSIATTACLCSRSLRSRSCACFCLEPPFALLLLGRRTLSLGTAPAPSPVPAPLYARRSAFATLAPVPAPLPASLLRPALRRSSAFLEARQQCRGLPVPRAPAAPRPPRVRAAKASRSCSTATHRATPAAVDQNRDAGTTVEETLHAPVGVQWMCNEGGRAGGRAGGDPLLVR